ncbi:hypothetical protein CAOG_02568 [Capsaspora owczarzaki ATCC 30864]|uniref:UDP-N-acetylglucosamine transferase subunit ALG14 n=1 Tax=Capsaspora owczarzaki (strain ATCC 30864) TaxID=595528 RepID=A0A0D2WMK9_CAPO3|nr:hypothetical protein CAOG_02568 [Capsaspora owczarzaki ATCC 30864]KJE91433.1 hypothetical protein CAOG_002568 [Capsaspora owczarzaki ATCC 30864]|eukprot:XP_004349318.2 hypothetical protein CAOG_02568 [Capsaspora owczarzaki ATCC 30864]
MLWDAFAMPDSAASLLAIAGTVLLTLATLFTIWLFIRRRAWARVRAGRAQGRDQPCPTMVVLGSGGHTMEMMDLLRSLDPKRYTPRVYVLAQTDTTSQAKALGFEQQLARVGSVKHHHDDSVANKDVSISARTRSHKQRQGGKAAGSEAIESRLSNNARSAQQPSSLAPAAARWTAQPRQFWIETIPRSREVAQSWLTSLFTTAHALLFALPMVFRVRPELVLCNGPGTCVPVCIAAKLLYILGVCDTRVVYIESICRVETLSIAARLLKMLHIPDRVVVMWPQLNEKVSGCEYHGRLL